MEELTPFDPELDNEMAIDTCVENIVGAILKTLAASTSKCRPRDDPRPPIPTAIQGEIRLRRQWQVTRDPALKAKVNRLQRSVTRRLNEWSATLESRDPEDQSLWRMTKLVIRVHTPFPPCLTQGESLPQTLRKQKALQKIWRICCSR